MNMHLVIQKLNTYLISQGRRSELIDTDNISRELVTLWFMNMSKDRPDLSAEPLSAIINSRDMQLADCTDTAEILIHRINYLRSTEQFEKKDGTVITIRPDNLKIKVGLEWMHSVEYTCPTSELKRTLKAAMKTNIGQMLRITNPSDPNHVVGIYLFSTDSYALNDPSNRYLLCNNIGELTAAINQVFEIERAETVTLNIDYYDIESEATYFFLVAIQKTEKLLKELKPQPLAQKHQPQSTEQSSEKNQEKKPAARLVTVNPRNHSLFEKMTDQAIPGLEQLMLEYQSGNQTAVATATALLAILNTLPTLPIVNAIINNINHFLYKETSSFLCLGSTRTRRYPEMKTAAHETHSATKYKVAPDAQPHDIDAKSRAAESHVHIITALQKKPVSEDKKHIAAAKAESQRPAPMAGWNIIVTPPQQLVPVPTPTPAPALMMRLTG